MTKTHCDLCDEVIEFGKVDRIRLDNYTGPYADVCGDCKGKYAAIIQPIEDEYMATLRRGTQEKLRKIKELFPNTTLGGAEASD